MNSKPETRNPKPEFPSLALLAFGAIALPAHGWQLATNLTLKADVTLKETFDSNVYLQDYTPSALVPNAAQPFQESLPVLPTSSANQALLGRSLTRLCSVIAVRRPAGTRRVVTWLAAPP